MEAGLELGTFAPLHIGFGEAALRFGAAVLLPLLIGVERFVARKPIDFRPFVIISAAACALALGGVELAWRTEDPQIRVDPTRIFEGVITGIGFLGAGAMFRRGNYVQGAGSASAVWAAGCIGLLSGCGFLWLATMLAAAVLIVLIASAPLTERYDADSPPSRKQEGQGLKSGP